MGKGFSEFLGVGKIYAFVGCVRISLGSDKTEGHYEGVGVHLVELVEKWNTTTNLLTNCTHPTLELGYQKFQVSTWAVAAKGVGIFEFLLTTHVGHIENGIIVSG